MEMEVEMKMESRSDVLYIRFMRRKDGVSQGGERERKGGRGRRGRIKREGEGDVIASEGVEHVT